MGYFFDKLREIKISLYFFGETAIIIEKNFLRKGWFK